MDFFKKTLLVMFILVVGSFNAKRTTLGTVSQQSNSDHSLFGSNQTNSEDFWKIFMSGLNERVNEPVKKMPAKDALVIVGAMNNVADVFNQDYSFTELDPLLVMSKLKLFLANPKNQPQLKKFLQILKDNIVNFPEQFSSIAMKLDQSINEKNAEQFYSIYSALERYFRGLPIKPLIRTSQAGWFASIKNAIMNRARRAYDYLFSKKSEDSRVVSKYIITSHDSAGKPVTKMITEIKDATGKVISYEEAVKK